MDELSLVLSQVPFVLPPVAAFPPVEGLPPVAGVPPLPGPAPPVPGAPPVFVGVPEQELQVLSQK
jgi:hypothetical protein